MNSFREEFVFFQSILALSPCSSTLFSIKATYMHSIKESVSTGVCVAVDVLLGFRAVSPIKRSAVFPLD